MPVDELPSFGLGTYRNTDPEECAESVRMALNEGYRHVDTAQGYDNEAAVAEGIARSDVDREDVFLATKVSTDHLAHDDVLASTEESLERLDVDAVDLLYVHWPIGEYDAEGTLAAFDELYDAGAIRHVGLSNFQPDQLDEARALLDAPVYAHQVELHPLLPQAELREYAEAHDHRLVAYSPIARNEVAEVDAIREVAAKHDATPAQVSLAWLLEKGVAVIPKATGAEHIRENWAARGLALDEEDVARIDAVGREERVVDFDAAPWNE